MKVYATCTTYDSEEIIGYVVDHLISQNVDGIVVSDNESRDATVDILREKAKICKTKGIDFVLLNDPEIAFNINEKHNRLVKVAVERAGGLAWIISAEADEFWGSTKGPLADVLKSSEVMEMAKKPPPGNRLRMTNDLCGFFYNQTPFLVTGEDDPNEPNPLKRMCWKVGPGEPIMPEGRRQRQLTKVLFPADSSWIEKFGMRGGCANIHCNKDFAQSLKVKAQPHFWSGGNLFYARHYPVWSLEQMKRKYRVIKERMEMTSKLLSMLGVASDRLRLEWISASEGKIFAEVMSEFIDKIKELGPLTPEVKA